MGDVTVIEKEMKMEYIGIKLQLLKASYTAKIVHISNINYFN